MRGVENTVEIHSLPQTPGAEPWSRLCHLPHLSGSEATIQFYFKISFFSKQTQLEWFFSVFVKFVFLAVQML